MTDRRYSLGGAGRDYNSRTFREPVLTEQQRAERQARNDKLLADFIEKAGWNKPRDTFGKIIDREARVAVEGDTDSNHDNLEG